MCNAPTRSCTCARPASILRRLVLAVLLAASMTPPVQGLTLMESYRAALERDPTFQSARFERMAGEESETIGRSNLLPSVGFSYSYSQNDADRTTFITNRPAQPETLQYNSKVTTLTLRQPLLNLDAWQRYKGGQAQVRFSEAKFASGLQDLITRLTTAYLEVLLAEDQLRLALAQRDAYQENQLANERMFEKGAGTRTDVLETRARYDLAQAQVIEAENHVTNRRDELAVIIGGDPGKLDALASSLPALPMPATLAEWERIAKEINPEVQALRQSAAYAEADVERNRAGHYPRIDLVASHSRNIADSLFTYNQQSAVNSVGVQMSLPIYSGGSVNAQTRQAAARLASSQADLDAGLQKALVEVRKQFQLLISSQMKMRAMEQAERSAAEALEATRKSVVGGQRVNLDVLTALQQLYTTRRDLSGARHGYLLAFLRLHAAAGMLSEDSLGKIALCFTGQR